MKNQQLLKGLFLTTGIVLGVLFHPTGRDEDLGFALVSMAVFYGMSYLAQHRGIMSQVFVFLGAAVVWFGLYLLFRAL
ncbi:hypothetical protein I2I05_21620 [Hymenobacter sp. BT683]|uniref:Uncharacterized protein n=1 Tax=Hymenobacter jeongseonensis TaxID=2791027 RepID=A0ABS0IPK9_9BACT|nr:hypothetical protein [Hymenobacter jeongseonensis]MBF9240004.1 hypothetical protein [Hymenobacter jeongseonensis]